ncbi:hypothetical protein LCGC14_0711700 [marine sediment metagenome]|uniref:Uncharacterized protein n=2 Tax=root TaxID=1 RepID=A0A831QRA9_9FLAO|nr:hypothetical protein [Pricia antarctica]
MTQNRIAAFLIFIFLIVSCNNDDGPATPEPIPPRPLTEVAVEEDAKIQAYIDTHFYNYEEFDSIPENFDFKIVIDTIAGENSDKRSLAEDMTSETVAVSSSDLGIEEGGDVQLTYYYLVAREGEGGSPTVADSTFFKYEGRRLNGELFDSSTSFSWRYLPNFLRGFSIGMSKLNAGGDIIVNNDGTTSIENTGIGLIIFPSGLGYYNVPRGTIIQQYDPLLFTLELGLYEEDTDYDNDGIPSILEDVNGDGILNNDNTDGDFSATQSGNRPIYNHEDTDDDNDGIPTRDEISFDDAGNLILPFPDADNDGVPDHLDPDTN